MCTSVGIMHEGRLLRSGSIDSTLESIQAEAAVVRIELIETVDPARTWLEAHEAVDEVVSEGLRISFRFRGDKRAQSELLSRMIREDLGLVSFSPKQSGIESLLMNLITEEKDS
jgi:hypothetical protein